MNEQTNRDRFLIILTGQLERLFERPDYAAAAARHSPASLAAKLADGLVTGSASKDGDAIHITCKVLGVKHTYRDIKRFLTTGNPGVQS